MTLREKFIKCRNKLNQYYVLPITDDAEQLEKISDDYAIEFAEWCDNDYFRMGNTNIWSHTTDWEDNLKFTTKELLEIFKKEKGL
jgi:hypothetical protein